MGLAIAVFYQCTYVQVFDLLRSECPDFAKKIISIPGNISEEGLGLSVSDRELLVNNVCGK